MHAALMLYLHFVLLYSDIVIAVVNMYTAIFGSKPHGWLIHLFLCCRIIDTRNIAT